MAGREASGMNRLNYVALVSGKIFRPTFVFILLVLAGGTSDTKGQTLTTLWSFSGTDGYDPKDGLVQGSDGNFYGTTFLGWTIFLGSTNYGGTVFRITPSGSLTNLHFFNSMIGEGV